MKNHIYSLPLAVGVLAIAVTGGVIFAQNASSEENIISQNGTSTGGLANQISSIYQGESGRIDLSHGDAPKQSIASRVAEILKIEESVLHGAFTQARREKQNDSMANRLEHLVTDEKLTQEQADEIQTWFLSRPDAVAKLHRLMRRGREAVEHRLTHMVERGVISQADADAVLKWHGEMPQAFKDLSEQRFHRSSERFQGWGMNRSAFKGHRFGRQGFAGRGFQRGGMRNRKMEGSHGLDPAGTQ